MVGRRGKQPRAAPDPLESSSPPVRRSKRATASQGGYTDQLERVATLIETPRQPPRRVNLPDDEPVNPMAPTLHGPRKKASHRSGKGSEDKSSVAPSSQLLPMVQTVWPVSEPAMPDGCFGYQVPPPVPTFVSSQSVAAFQQDHNAKKAARSMTSTGGKTSSSNMQVFSGPRSLPTSGVHHTPVPSVRGVSIPPSDGRSSPLSEVEDESQQTGAINNQLWNIEEEKADEIEDEGGGKVGQQDNSDDEEADRTRFLDMYEDGHAARPNDPSNGGAMEDVTSTDTEDENMFCGYHDDALARPQRTQHADSWQPSMPPSVQRQRADDLCPVGTQSEQSSNRRFEARVPAQARAPAQARVPTRVHHPARAQDPCAPPQPRTQAQDVHVPSQSRAQTQDSHAPSQPRAQAQDIRVPSRTQAQGHGHHALSQRRAQAQDLCVPSKSRPQSQDPRGQVRQQALISPPTTRSNSIVGDPVSDAERSHRPGDEVVGLKFPGIYKLTVSQVGIGYDLLTRHHTTNGCRRPPSPTYLDGVRSNGTGNYKKARKDTSNEGSTSVNPQALSGDSKDMTNDSSENQLKVRKGRWSVNLKGSKPVSPTTLAFYPPLWQKLLDLAKARMRLYVTVENPFPTLANSLEGACQECLFEVLAYYEDNDLEVEADYYPKHKRDMARLLYNDISTYRSEIKKLVTQIVPLHYQLSPLTAAKTDVERRRSIRNQAEALLDDWVFLRGDPDEQVIDLCCCHL
ncbi:hypothetical protein JVT61DRAFT_7065 [Boletus reticuloceps]|uniref:DUF6532 domain-containing protein n=1 Tax=Boletus reticuloceps TaxID=495285 RepID=A0A8I2YK39_9AGAM|nr:hypothetical protein JVT61DRAFT_7065 [Boletus reticuloceps]